MHSDATLLLSHDVTALVSRYVETFITLSTRDLKNFFFSLLCNILLNNWENSAVVQSVASECPKLHVYL